MTTIKRRLKTKPEVVAVALGFAIGLGLALHEVFFLVPLIFVLGLPCAWTAEKARQFFRHFYPQFHIDIHEQNQNYTPELMVIIRRS
jgi:hypothetical protein